MTRLTRCPDVLWRMVDDYVLTRAVNGSPYDLVGTSAMVWIALDSPAGLAEIEQRIAEVVPGVATALLAETLADMCELGLLSEAT